MSYNKSRKTTNHEEVDPSIYYYDEVYDDMKAEEETCSRSDGSSTSKTNRTSKYIEGILETSEQRKLDKEIRKFKKYARDKEEAQTYGALSDGDVYITPAYKKRLDEINKIEEQRKKKLSSEKDRCMNFMKTSHEDSGSKVVIDNPKGPDNLISNEKPSLEVNLDKLAHNTDKKPIISSRDRRDYLEEMLAKRTVGVAYDEAVERYKKRKPSLKARC